MNIVINHFYFIKDDFYAFAKDSLLMENKECGSKRPCFLAIKNADGIIWMIPVTSKITKFRKIYNEKMANYGSCDNIVISKLLGRDCAYLIQNMFPISEKYIKEEYVQSSNNVAVTIPDYLANVITTKQKKVLALVRAGIKGIVFPDVLKIEKKLKEEISSQNIDK